MVFVTVATFFITFFEKVIKVCIKLAFRVFEPFIDWCAISVLPHLELDFLSSFKDSLNWTEVFSKNESPEDLDTEVTDCLKTEDPVVLSKTQKNTEDFKRKFGDKQDWWNKSLKQILAKEFLESFITSVKEHQKNYSESDLLSELEMCKNISKDTPLFRLLKDFINSIDWETKPDVDKLFREFLEEFPFF